MSISALLPREAGAAIVFRDENGHAARRHDVVAYWTEKRSVRGRTEHTLPWSGALWFFSSAQNLELFRANPVRYAPQYGCHCTVSMAHGKLGGVSDPPNWTIYRGRLFFNGTHAAQSHFNTNPDEYIDKADIHWKKFANL